MSEYYLSGALNNSSASLAQQIAGVTAGQAANITMREHISLDLSPSGEYMLSTTAYGTGSFNENGPYLPSLVIYQSSSVSGYQPVKTILLKGVYDIDGSQVRARDFDPQRNLTSQIFISDREILSVGNQWDQDGTGQGADIEDGVFMVITGSGANWGISQFITGGVLTTTAQSRAANETATGIGTFLAANESNVIKTNNRFGSAPPTRAAVFNGIDETAGNNQVTIFQSGASGWSFHSQFDPGDVNSGAPGAGTWSDNEFYVKDVAFIEENLLIIAYNDMDEPEGTKTTALEYSSGTWTVFHPPGSSAQFFYSFHQATGGTDNEDMELGNDGISWIEYDDTNNRYWSFKKNGGAVTVDQYDSGSNWLGTKFYPQGVTHAPGPPDRTKTFSSHPGYNNTSATARASAWSDIKHARMWTDTSGNMSAISIIPRDSNNRDEDSKGRFNFIESGSSGWFGDGSEDKILHDDIVGKDALSKLSNDGIAVQHFSHLFGAGHGYQFAWNTMYAGNADRFVYREGSNTGTSPGRLAVLSFRGFPLSTSPGFTLTPSADPLNITEASTGTIGVKLDKQPTSDVVIDVTLANSFSGRASLSTAALTFTNGNWDTLQTVTVTATANNIDDDNATGNITFSVNDGSSSDEYDSVADQTVALTIVDNDTRGLNFLPGTSLSTTEAGASTVLSITLNSEPTADVIVTCTSPDSTEGTMSPDPVSLTFTAENYSSTQTITFTGKQDEEIDGNIQYTVTVSSTSDDSKYNGLSQVITITNVDSGQTAGESGGGGGGGQDTSGGQTVPGGSGIPPNTTRRDEPGAGLQAETSKTLKPTIKTQADILPRKLHFEPSTIETIDRSVLSYLQDLDLFSNTNEGWKKVPVIWGTAERAYQVKHNRDIRDAQGMVKLPIISVRRVSVSKDMASKGVFQGNISEIQDGQGGSVQVSRVIYQEKTMKFANADALKLHSQDNYPRPNPKIVYRTVLAPMPVNVTVMYEIVLRTEYQQQMNNLILPFVTNPGTINYVRLFDGEHRYEAFIQGEFQNGDNLSDFSSDERKFETKIQLKVVGYLIGQEDNREKPHYSVRENAVEVKIPRERISLNEVPPHEFGAYYGLSGIEAPLLLSGFHAPFFFSNVPAVGSGGGGGSANEGSVSTNIVTVTNFAEVMADNLVIRETLKDLEDALPEDKVTFIVSSATIRLNTETLYLNGVLMEPGASKDYTISGNTITFTSQLSDEDTVFITYIKS